MIGMIQGRRESCPHAFTLIELMVVLVVVGLMASMILPALGRARDQGRRITCLGNLRQWGLATLLYVDDHDGFLPPDGTPNPGASSTNQGWYIQLPKQLGLPPYHAEPWRTNAEAALDPSPWICPANPRRSNGRNLFHYCLNGHVNGTGSGNRPVQLSHVPHPALTVWLFDSKNLPAVGYWGYVHTNLHGGGAQLLFLDGHVTRYRKAEYWDEVADRARSDNPEILWVP